MSLLEIADVFNFLHRSQNYGKMEQYNRTLIAMLHCYVDDHQED